MLENPYVRITNNFLHDMATGMWAAGLLVIWLLAARVTAATPADAVSALSDASRAVFWLLLAALAVIIVTGAVRLLYWRRQTPAEELAAKRRALVVKHVAFVVIYGGGTWWAYGLLG